MPCPAPAASRLPGMRVLRKAPGSRADRSRPRRGGAVATIAVDTLGADRGAEEVSAGASSAATDGTRCILFGPEAEVRAGLAAYPASQIEVVDAPDGISNREEPARAVRRTPDASIVQAAKAVADGRADALLSAGSTGATLAASLLHLKRLPGVYRPAVAALLPLPAGDLLLLDVGANVVVRPEHLVQFAHMGAAFSERLLGIERPRVALLSVGEEPGKGTPDVVTAHEQLASSGLNFVGNVEGTGLAAGESDVVVTDGFTGNVALKLMEGTARSIVGAIRDAARAGTVSKLGGLLLKPKLRGLRERLDPERVGGAYLLGLRGLVVICHGSSSRRAIASATELASRGVEERVVEKTSEALAAAGVLRGEKSPTPSDDPAPASSVGAGSFDARP
jgi:phosphate acyltransferase